MKIQWLERSVDIYYNNNNINSYIFIYTCTIFIIFLNKIYKYIIFIILFIIYNTIYIYIFYIYNSFDIIHIILLNI